MFEEIDELKNQLQRDTSARRQLFSFDSGKTELGGVTVALGGGSHMILLSPSHVTKAIYFSVALMLAPGARVEVEGDFECIVPDGLIRMPIRELEVASKGGVGWPDAPTQRFVSPLINAESVQRRLGLRLIELSQIPADFLLFYPTFRCNETAVPITPTLFRTRPCRGVCIVDPPSVQPDGIS